MVKLVSPGMAIFPSTVRLNQQPLATYPSCLKRKATFNNQTGENTFTWNSLFVLCGPLG